MNKSVNEMLDEASSLVTEIEVEKAKKFLNDSETLFVDVRDFNTIKETGKIKNAIHAERGMIEFYADENHSLSKKDLQKNKRIIVYCSAGGQAKLAGKTLLDMGFKKVNRIESFDSWKNADGAIEEF